MKSKKATRRALLTSMLSLLICVSMLVGSTFAWFTDSVTSQNNIIKSGNLDVELYYQVEGQTDWTKVTEDTSIFMKDALWEPGHTEVVKLKVVNEGTLALKYQLGVNIVSETESTNVKNEPLKLSDHIKFGIVEGDQDYTRDTAVAAVDATATALNKAYSSDVIKLLPKTDTNADNEDIVTLVVYMPTTVGNEANYAKGAAVPTINLGINLLATQMEAEMDSFGNDYDKNAWSEVAEVPTPDTNGVVNVYTAEQLAGVMGNTAGIKTINIIEDIDLAGRTWTPAFVSAPDLVINGNGHTISNMTTSGDNNVGFIGAAYQNLTINDLTFKNAKVEATGSFVGGIIGNAWDHADITFNNVDLVDSEVSTTIPNKAIRVGGLIGYSPYTRGDLTLKDCDVSGSTITGYHNVGAMVGTMMFYGAEQGSITIENCTAKDNTLKYGSPNVGAFAFGASTSGYTEYTPAGFTAENNKTVAVANVNADLQTLMNKGANEIELPAGEYKMPSSDTTGTVKISGTKETVLDVTLGAYMDSAAGVTIEGVTIKTSTGYANGNGSDYAALYAKNVTYVNCTFVGPMRVGRDGAKFVNCTFTKLGNDYVWTYGNDVTFEGCTFNTDGKAILIYSDGGSEVSQVTVKNCTFNSTQGAKAGAIANQNCAAIEIHNYGNGVNLTTSGNTRDSNFSGEWRIKTYETGKPQVFVNGTEYTQIALDGKLMTIDSSKNVTVIG